MIIAIDGRPLVGNRTGIGVHTAEIASRLTRTTPILLTHRAIDDLSGIAEVDRRVHRISPGVAWQQIVLPQMARRAGADVLWGPHGTLPWNLKLPSVVSIHDFTSITMPMKHRLRTVLSFNSLVGWSLQRATKIAAVSRHTADQAIRHFGIEAGRVEVVPNGVDFDFFSTPSATKESASPYVLYAGTFEPRKGLPTLFEAWRQLRERPRLVLTGDRGWRESTLRSEMEPFVSTGQIEMTGYVTRERLRSLYQNALVFVYPAEGEGFGLPPLEAMAAGTPVVACRSGAIAEVTGDAALLAMPGDAASLATHLQQLLSNQGMRNEQVEKGRHCARRFSWSTSARLMEELFLGAAVRG